MGAGGHARVCLEALADSGFELAGCVSSDGAGVVGLPCPVLGTDADLAAIAAREGATHLFVAVGDNRAREAIIARCRATGLPLATAISRFAMVSPAAIVGEGVLVAAGAVLNPSAVVGDGVIVNTRASIDHDCIVGACAHIAVGVSLAGGVKVGERAMLGIGSVVLPLCTVGDDAVVGGGAVVVRDVPAGATVIDRKSVV